MARMAERAKAVSLPLVYAHLVGGQDEVVFDGASFALAGRWPHGAAGRELQGAAGLRPDGARARAASASCATRPPSPPRAKPRPSSGTRWCVGVRDYIGKNGFPGAILGLSGGIDSALVLAIAVDALGKDKVRAVMMPSPYTADISWIDAREMAKRLGVRYDEISDQAHLRVLPGRLGRRVQGPAPRTRPRKTSRRASAARC